MEKENHPKRTQRSNDWANDPRIKKQFPKLSEALTEDRRKSIERIRELGLPMAKSVTTDLESFLANPDEFFAGLPPGKYYISLNPYEHGREGLERCGEADKTREEVMDYIKVNIPSDKTGQYEIKLEEYANRYGGTIIIGGKNEVWVELKEGTQAEIGSGTAAPGFIAHRDRHNGVMRYSFEDEELRKAIFETLQVIPHKGERYDTEYHPGYYEFALFERDGKLRPIFFDYKDNPEFQQNWKRQGESYARKEKKYESFLGEPVESKKALTRADSAFMLRKTKDRNLGMYLTFFDREIGDLRDKKILNVGSGAGIFESEAKAKGLDITSVDMAYVLEEMRTNFLKNNPADRAIAGLAGELPLKRDTFDLSFYFFSSFHYPKDEKDLSEMLEEGLRVLKQGGKMLIYPAFFDKDGEPILSFSSEVNNQKQLQDHFKKIIQDKRKSGTLKMSPMISSKIEDFDICYLEIKKL